MDEQYNRRSYDAGIAALTQKVTDLENFIAAREQSCQSMLLTRIVNAEDDVRILKGFMRKIDPIANWIGYIVITILAAMLGVFGYRGG
jgi:hypothetical protein